MKQLIDWISAAPSTRLPLVAMIVGLLGSIAGGLFTSIIWPWIKLALEKLWDILAAKFSKRGFEYRYLDWVVREHEFLPILPSTLVPVTKLNAQRLDRLYVTLSLESGNSKAADVSVADALRTNSTLVISGDPGAGKTTMLRFLALALAQARRKRSSAKTLKERRLDSQRIKDAQHLLRHHFGFKKIPLPIFVYLNRLRDVAEWPKEKSLLDIFCDELRGVDKVRDIPQDFFLEKVNNGECVFLLDAFDELGSQKSRDRVAWHVGQLASTVPQGNRILVTSRPVGYRGQLGMFGFAVLKIQPLAPLLIQELINKWYAALGEKDLADDLLKTLQSNQRIAELAVNPMLLSLVVLVQYVRRIIPDRRHLLYEECIKILVERRYAPPDVQRAYDAILPGEEARLVLKRLANRFHESHRREISRTELCGEILPDVLGDLRGSIPTGTKPADVLRNIEERSQLLIERGINESGDAVMAFAHLTFQEYLTAASLKEDEHFEHASEYLMSRYLLDPEWWEEVALLYAAQLTGTQRITFFENLYPR